VGHRYFRRSRRVWPGLNFEVTNDNNALFSTQPSVAPNGTLSYTPADNANGTATVSVTLHDDGGTANGRDDTSDTKTFAITVNPPCRIGLGHSEGRATGGWG